MSLHPCFPAQLENFVSFCEWGVTSTCSQLLVVGMSVLRGVGSASVENEIVST